MMDLIPDLSALILSLKLAVVTTGILLLVCTPLAWWLANTRNKFKPVIEAIAALPIVLPPTVIGFYLLIFLGPQGWFGSFWVDITGEAITFSFLGLVIASVIYSLPFVLQPIQGSFESVGQEPMETAATLGANPIDAFFSIAVPLAKRGFLTATIMGIAHTLGEFGVVLMVGGNIPGETRVISIAIYDHVEMLNYNSAHLTSLLLLAFSFSAMLVLYVVNRRELLR